MAVNKLTVRVYGVWIQNHALLVSDERTGDFAFRKLPGGGLQLGEGLMDCLKREFLEELGVHIDGAKWLYTNDDFIASAFDPEVQLISIYFQVFCKTMPTQMHLNETKWGKPYTHQFQWIPLQEITEEMFHFPIDKRMANTIKNLQ